MKVCTVDGCESRMKGHGYRWSYELHVGPIPEGLVIDHLCRNRGRVRPDHLEPVTNAENIKRGQTGQWRRRPVEEAS